MSAFVPPSVAEQNAAFDAAKADIRTAEAQVPEIFQGYVSGYITDALILRIVRAALDAAATVRAAPAAKT